MPRDEHIKLAPSILSADFARLGEHVAEATKAGADYIHVDVMDGQFVPNMTIGPLVVEAIRPHTHLPLDVHLMIVEPQRFIPHFAEALAKDLPSNASPDDSILTVHAEACPHLHRVVHQIKENGLRAGVALNPATPVSAVEEVLEDIDLVLVMTVNPGFPAQSFIESVVGKIERLRKLLDERGLKVELEVDGGISPRTVPTVVKAGARVLVAGSAVYNKETTVEEAIRRIRESVV